MFDARRHRRRVGFLRLIVPLAAVDRHPSYLTRRDSRGEDRERWRLVGIGSVFKFDEVESATAATNGVKHYRACDTPVDTCSSDSLTPSVRIPPYDNGTVEGTGRGSEEHFLVFHRNHSVHGKAAFSASILARPARNGVRFHNV